MTTERKTIDLGSMLWHAENLLNLADEHNQLMKEKQSYLDKLQSTFDRWDDNQRNNSLATSLLETWGITYKSDGNSLGPELFTSEGRSLGRWRAEDAGREFLGWSY